MSVWRAGTGRASDLKRRSQARRQNRERTHLGVAAGKVKGRKLRGFVDGIVPEALGAVGGRGPVAMVVERRSDVRERRKAIGCVGRDEGMKKSSNYIQRRLFKERERGVTRGRRLCALYRRTEERERRRRRRKGGQGREGSPYAVLQTATLQRSRVQLALRILRLPALLCGGRRERGRRERGGPRRWGEQQGN